MESTDLTIAVLKEIRDEVRASNARIDVTNEEVALVARRVVESEVRTSTAIADLAGTVRELTTVLRAQHDLRPRVERCERDIDDLKRRVG